MIGNERTGQGVATDYGRAGVNDIDKALEEFEKLPVKSQAPKQDMTGHRSGLFVCTGISNAKEQYGRIFWRFVCDGCGSERIVDTGRIKKRTFHCTPCEGGQVSKHIDWQKKYGETKADLFIALDADDAHKVALLAMQLERAAKKLKASR